MRKFIILGLAMIFSIPAHAVELRWKAKGIEKLDYETTADTDITGQLGNFTHIEWVNDTAKLEKLIDKLKDFPIPAPYMHYRMHLKSIRDHKAIRATMVGVQVKYKSKSEDEKIIALRQRIDALTNAIMMQGDFDLFGDSANLTFYRIPNERNILTTFFYLPKREVSVGEHWSLPVKLIELGPGIFVKHSAFYNRVTLTSLKDTPQGTVAQLQYIISENVDGYVERVANSRNGRPPFALSTSILGYGEFLVEQGHWLRQIWILAYHGTGKSKLNKQSLFAIELKR